MFTYIGSASYTSCSRLHYDCINLLLMIIITMEWVCRCYDRKKTVVPNHTLALSADFQILLGCSVWGWRRGLGCQQHDPLKKMFSSSGKQCIAVPCSAFLMILLAFMRVSFASDDTKKNAKFEMMCRGLHWHVVRHSILPPSFSRFSMELQSQKVMFQLTVLSIPRPWLYCFVNFTTEGPRRLGLWWSNW